MASHLFISMPTIIDLESKGVLVIQGQRIRFLPDGEQFSLESAVRFLGCEGMEAYGISMVGKVYSLREVEDMGGIFSTNGVFFGGANYQIQEGLLGTLVAIQDNLDQRPPVDRSNTLQDARRASGSHGLHQDVQDREEPDAHQEEDHGSGVPEEDDLLLQFLSGE